MAKQGVWGERNRIITPILYKRVTCATCSHYCRDDYSCMASAIMPKIDGYDYWKRCKLFDLSIDYCDANHQEQVRKIKGDNFFKAARKHETGLPSEIEQDEEPAQEDNLLILIDDPIDETAAETEEIPARFGDKLKYYLGRKHGISVGKIDSSGIGLPTNSECYVSMAEKIIIITIPKIKPGKALKHPSQTHIKIDKWSRFYEMMISVIKELSELPNANEFEKWIAMPIFPYSADESCAETFYHMKGSLLNGIKLVEMDDLGELLFATGPIYDTFWTAEKIRNLKIFKP